MNILDQIFLFLYIYIFISQLQYFFRKKYCSSVDVSIICFVQIVVYTTFKYQIHFAESLTCGKIMISKKTNTLVSFSTTMATVYLLYSKRKNRK